MKHTIKDLVKNGVNAHLDRVRKGLAYYNVHVHDETGLYKYSFPVDLADIGDATLNAVEKSMMLMRYIRKAIENGEISMATIEEYEPL